MLHFKVGPFPVDVQASFLITAVLLGGLSGSALDIALWVLVVFVSVLVHELGHAAFGKALGGRPEITLQAFGGVTFPNLRKPPRALQQIGLSVAGPLAGLALGGVAYVALRQGEPARGGPVYTTLAMFVTTSIYWAALNLLPIIPLDGGHVLEAALTGLRKRPSAALASKISIVFAVVAAAAAYFFTGSVYLPIFLGLFAVQNFARARQGDGRRPAAAAGAVTGPGATESADVERAAGVARQALLAGDEPGALAAAELLATGEGAFRQAAGQRIRAAVLLARGDAAAAGLAAGRSFATYPTSDAAVVAARANTRMGDRDAALSWLRRAVEAGAPVEAVTADPELGPIVEEARAAQAATTK